MRTIDNKPDNTWLYDVRDAIDAAARHNLNSIDTSAKKNPLAFLLILCDHLQEWDKSLMMGRDGRQSIVSGLLGKNCPGIAGEGLVDKIVIDGMEYKDGELFIARENIVFNLYFKKNISEYNPVLTWISYTYDLQNLRDCPDIVIKLIHSLVNDYREMDIFQAFLWENPELGILSDWAVSSRRKEDWFQYECIDNTNKKAEFFSIYLSRIGNNCPLLELPENYISKFIEYK